MHDHHATHLRGMLLCLAALLLFACQDAFTKVPARDYALAQFLLVRSWAFAVFATVFAVLRCGVGNAVRSARPLSQVFWPSEWRRPCNRRTRRVQPAVCLQPSGPRPAPRR